MAQLFFRYGAMNSGKTIEILKVAHNYEEQNKSVIIMTSGIDDRDSVGYVSSRIGMKRKAVPVFDEDDLYEKVVSIKIFIALCRQNRRNENDLLVLLQESNNEPACQ